MIEGKRSYRKSTACLFIIFTLCTVNINKYLSKNNFVFISRIQQNNN
jgi:hypothetical protein